MAESNKIMVFKLPMPTNKKFSNVKIEIKIMNGEFIILNPFITGEKCFFEKKQFIKVSLRRLANVKGAFESTFSCNKFSLLLEKLI